MRAPCMRTYACMRARMCTGMRSPCVPPRPCLKSQDHYASTGRYMQVHAGTHAGACRYTQVHAGTCKFMHVYTGTCVYMRVHARVHACICVYMRVHMRAYACMRAYLLGLVKKGQDHSDIVRPLIVLPWVRVGVRELGSGSGLGLPSPFTLRTCSERGPTSSHFTPYTSCLVLHASHFTPHTSYFALHTSHFTRRTSHIALYTSHFTHFALHTCSHSR